MPITIFWFRRDLRLQDNAGLYRALKGNYPVLPLFIFDTNILDDLENKKDTRVSFIHNHVSRIGRELAALGSSIIVKYGKPKEVWRELLNTYNIGAVYANRDYEPYSIQRDQEVEVLLNQSNIPFYSFKDHVIFEKLEVAKNNGTPYSVFTPYSRKWKEKLKTKKAVGKNVDPQLSFYFQSYPTEKYFDHFYPSKTLKQLTLTDIGFNPSSIAIPPMTIKRGLIKNYGATRDYPAQEGTSRLGIHFRFGTISIREKARRAVHLSETFLNELIWRDFYAMVLANHPYVVNRAFKEKYDAIQWRNDEEDFKKWCEGKTGYPIVDAGMRQLNQTAYMHNRVRMIVASFLCKHLLIDWRWGAAYFAKKLLDYDLASNNGAWQWAAGCGTDAVPYFRIFNPEAQQKKFDKDFEYIKKWVEEFNTDAYPPKIVNHQTARQRCLEVYKKAL